MSQGNAMPAQAAADSSRAVCSLHSDTEATSYFGYYWPLRSGVGREKSQPETWHSFKPTSSHLHIQKSRNHTMLWRVTTPLRRGQGQSCTAVTHSFLFPSSFNSCLVLAKEQQRIKIQPNREAQLKLLISSAWSFCSKSTSTCTADGWKVATKATPDQERDAFTLLPHLTLVWNAHVGLQTWPLWPVSAKVVQAPRHLSWPFMLLQAMNPSAILYEAQWTETAHPRRHGTLSVWRFLLMFGVCCFFQSLLYEVPLKTIIWPQII